VRIITHVEQHARRDTTFPSLKVHGLESVLWRDRPSEICAYAGFARRVGLSTTSDHIGEIGPHRSLIVYRTESQT